MNSTLEVDRTQIFAPRSRSAPAAGTAAARTVSPRVSPTVIPGAGENTGGVSTDGVATGGVATGGVTTTDEAGDGTRRDDALTTASESVRFEPVTRTRRYRPASAAATVYLLVAAPLPGAVSHVEPSADDCHAYA